MVAVEVLSSVLRALTPVATEINGIKTADSLLWSSYTISLFLQTISTPRCDVSIGIEGQGG